MEVSKMQVIARAFDRRRGVHTADIACDEAGVVYVRKPRARKWAPVHPGLNPTLDAYIANLEGNFGWKVEVL